LTPLQSVQTEMYVAMMAVVASDALRYLFCRQKCIGNETSD